MIWEVGIPGKAGVSWSLPRSQLERSFKLTMIRNAPIYSLSRRSQQNVD